MRDLKKYGDNNYGEIIIEQIKSGGFAGIRKHTTLYTGKCPSINEFRTICKLLNIN